jgi:hypothetical protein
MTTWEAPSTSVMSGSCTNAIVRRRPSLRISCIRARRFIGGSTSSPTQRANTARSSLPTGSQDSKRPRSGILETGHCSFTTPTRPTTPSSSSAAATPCCSPRSRRVAWRPTTTPREDVPHHRSRGLRAPSLTRGRLLTRSGVAEKPAGSDECCWWLLADVSLVSQIAGP